MSPAATLAVEEPLWFGPPDRPLFGWLTTPSVPEVRGGVLLAPPIGREARAVRVALRRLALALAAQGFVSLRFDYDGTGDSSGKLDDPDRDLAWTASVGHAARLLRTCGLSSVSAVGVRLGATIVAVAAATDKLDLTSLVMWDPCESGRNYLRELGALEALRREHVDVDSDGSVETAEFVFSSQTAGELRKLNLLKLEGAPLAERLLAVVRDDRTVSERLRRRLEKEQVEWTSVSDQAAMLDVDPLHAAVPTSTIQAIAQWLRRQPGVTQPFTPPRSASEAIVGVVGRRPVRERAVTLGPNGLFGIVSEPSDEVHGPLVVFLNVSNEEHIGPSRLWVELARRWASAGLQCLRFDLTGLGDSPLPPGHTISWMYDQKWLTDMPDVASALRPHDPSDTVFVGLCSGAYLAVEGGRTLRSRGVCIINPPVGIDFLHGVNALGNARRPWKRKLSEQLREVAIRLRWVSVAVWYVARLLLPSAFNVDVLADVVANGTDLFVLASSEDLSPYPKVQRLDKFFSRRLVAPSSYAVTFVPGLDHSMHAADGRDRAVAMLSEHVLETFCEEPSATADQINESKEQG